MNISDNWSESIFEKQWDWAHNAGLEASIEYRGELLPDGSWLEDEAPYHWVVFDNSVDPSLDATIGSGDAPGLHEAMLYADVVLRDGGNVL